MKTGNITPAVGLDFGTTNSSVAVARPDGTVQFVNFPFAGSVTRSSRSVLYLQRRTGALAKSASVWTGPEAIERYLQSDNFDEDLRGRLIQSLKSYLASRTFTGTEIFGRHYRLEDLLGRLLADLRAHASLAFGFEVTRAVVGRPVTFVGAESAADNDFAQERLHAALLAGGFLDIHFEMEPVAAARMYGADLRREETILIGDFGGGTTDFSLVRMGGQQPRVLGTTGVGLAGDAFDAKIVRYLISPALGSDSMARSLHHLLPALPAWIYANLERWHTLSFLQTRPVMEMLRAAHKRALEPHKIAALITLVEHDLGYRLHGAVQALKIDLSSHTETEFVFDADLLQLHATVCRDSFEGWIAPEVQRIERSLHDLMDRTAIADEAVDRVFLTGGTSLVPAVRRVFTRRFGEERVLSHDVFTSVAHGLAIMAQGR